MATQEISDGSYSAVRNKDTNEVTIRGTLRLNGTAEYAPIMALLEEGLSAGMITVDLRGLQFLNSSGIAFLMRFAIKVRDSKGSLRLRGSKKIPWHSKSLQNLQRIVPEIRVELE